MRDLRNVDYELGYESHECDLVNDFYLPVLDNSLQYDRLCGYFKSTVFNLINRSLIEFAVSHGKIRMICSHHLSKEDIKAMDEGYQYDKIIEEETKELVKNKDSEAFKNVEILATLIKHNCIDIKIAFVKDPENHKIFHKKIGIFKDEQDNCISFTGSINESFNAWTGNIEDFDVFCSWEEKREQKRIKRHMRRFENFWENKNLGKACEVRPFPEVAKKELKKVAKENIKDCLIDEQKTKEDKKWAHQDEAVSVFLKKKIGILEMATGTGKTRTSFKIMKKLLSLEKVKNIIIAMTSVPLLNQWYGELVANLADFPNLNTVHRQYENHKGAEQFLISPKNSVLICRPENGLPFALKNLNEDQLSETILIYDEVHGLGTTTNIKNLRGLSENIPYRLGLSATSEREDDEDGNTLIQEEVGDVIYSFPLEKAIEKGVVTPFKYQTIQFELTEDEKEERNKWIRTLNTEKNKLHPDPFKIKLFRTNIANVRKNSKAMIPQFEKFLKENTDHSDLLKRCVIFVNEKEYGVEVGEKIYDYTTNISTFYEGEGFDTLKEFDKSSLDCLISCTRLNEGIDVKTLSTVFLFSSDRKKLQTIQRIGRCLRTDQNNPGKIANVIDFISGNWKDNKFKADPVDEEREIFLSGLSAIKYKEE